MKANKELEEDKKKESIAKKKLSSRKFFIWVVWLVILFLIIAAVVTSIIITKKVDPGFTGLLKVIINDFFVISLVYLGVNVTQKGIFAFVDWMGKDKKCDS